jgi:hypothetical protein
MNDLFFFSLFSLSNFPFFSFHLCLFVALVLSFPLTFLLFCCFGVVSLSGDDGLPLCNWLHHQMHNGNGAEVIGIEKNRKLDNYYSSHKSEESGIKIS